MNIVIEILTIVLTVCAGPDKPIAIASDDSTYESTWCVERGVAGTSTVVIEGRIASAATKFGPWTELATARRTTLDGKYVSFKATQPGTSRIQFRVRETDLGNRVVTGPKSKQFKVWPDYDFDDDRLVSTPDFIELRKRGTGAAELTMFKRVFGVVVRPIVLQGKATKLYLRRRHWNGQ